jgi:hypothetical protein
MRLRSPLQPIQSRLTTVHCERLLRELRGVEAPRDLQECGNSVMEGFACARTVDHINAKEKTKEMHNSIKKCELMSH